MRFSETKFDINLSSYCLKTLSLMNFSKEVDDGDEISCKFCNSIMILKDGVWVLSNKRHLVYYERKKYGNRDIYPIQAIWSKTD